MRKGGGLIRRLMRAGSAMRRPVALRRVPAAAVLGGAPKAPRAPMRAPKAPRAPRFR